MHAWNNKENVTLLKFNLLWRFNFVLLKVSIKSFITLGCVSRANAIPSG